MRRSLCTPPVARTASTPTARRIRTALPSTAGSAQVHRRAVRPSRGNSPAELRRPDTIYASAHTGGHSKRSLQTVGPLAARLGLEVVKRYAAGDEAHLAREIKNRPGATLVAWHHEALHTIVHHLGEVHPRPPDYWPPDRFDLIWTFTPVNHGWHFAQVPQLLLPGDLPYPIAARPSPAKS